MSRADSAAGHEAGHGIAISAELVLPALGALIDLVIKAEDLFGPNTGRQKRTQVWTRLIQKLYDAADALAQWPPQQDEWVKQTLIPMAIETAVGFFNDYHQRSFDPALKPQAIHFLVDRIPEIHAA